MRTQDNYKRVKASVVKLSKNKIETIEATLPFIPLVITSLCISLLTILCSFFAREFLPPEIPLLFGLPKGQEQLTTTNGIMIPGLISLGFLIINSFLSSSLSDDYLKKTLVVVSFSLAIFATIATIEIFSFSW